MAAKFEVARAELNFEAGYVQPAFELFRDPALLLRSVFTRLSPYGVRLTDIRDDRGAGNVGDYHLLCYLFNYVMTVRVRVDRVEVYCSQLLREDIPKFGAAMIDVVRAVRDHPAATGFRAYALALGLHGIIEAQRPREFMSHFAALVPQGLGPSTGNGAVFYFGAEGDRLSSSLTIDLSAFVADALYVRPQAIWDAKQVEIESLPVRGDAFVRQALDQIGLELLQ